MTTVLLVSAAVSSLLGLSVARVIVQTLHMIEYALNKKLTMMCASGLRWKSVGVAMGSTIG